MIPITSLDLLQTPHQSVRKKFEDMFYLWYYLVDVASCPGSLKKKCVSIIKKEFKYLFKLFIIYQ